ncbi:MAG: hypothetical protein AB1668_02905 [Nanoarchaeota archaeon]
MERIGRISKGTLMDQIYLPKNRSGLKIGEYVIIKPLEEKEKEESRQMAGKLYFYGVRSLEPVKVDLINSTISIFLKSKKINKEEVDKAILKEFSLKSISQIKENLLIEKEFLPKYLQLYRQTFNSILRGMAHEAK